jgi:hypothetical protein
VDFENAHPARDLFSSQILFVCNALIARFREEIVFEAGGRSALKANIEIFDAFIQLANAAAVRLVARLFPVRRWIRQTFHGFNPIRITSAT